MSPCRWSSTLQGVEEEVEADEEQANRDAAKASEYHAAMRAAVAEGQAVWFNIKDADARLGEPLSPIPEQTPEHAEVDLNDMYDFSRFTSGKDAPREEALRRAQELERQLATRKLQELERQLEDQRQWADARFEQQQQQLEKASRTRDRAQSQVIRLEAALSLQKMESDKLRLQVEQLDELLAQKESGLQALSPAQPGDMPPEAAEQLQLLAQVADELTDALERANVAELEAKDQLARAQQRLDGQASDVERVRAALTSEISRAEALARTVEEERAMRDSLLCSIRSFETDCERLRAEAVAARDASTACRLDHAAEVEELQDRIACVEAELDVQIALASKGKSNRWRSFAI